MIYCSPQAQHLLCLINDSAYHELIPIIYEQQEEIARAFQNLEFENKNVINIYPNPVAGYGIIQIEVDDAPSGIQFLIADISGRIIKKYTLKDGINYIEISNKMLEPGTYIGYVEGLPSGTLNKQFIIIQ